MFNIIRVLGTVFLAVREDKKSPGSAVCSREFAGIVPRMCPDQRRGGVLEGKKGRGRSVRYSSSSSSSFWVLETVMLEIVPCHHLSLVPNMDTNPILPACAARVTFCNDREGIRQEKLRVSSPRGSSIQPIALAEGMVGFVVQ